MGNLLNFNALGKNRKSFVFFKWRILSTEKNLQNNKYEAIIKIEIK